MSVPMLGDRRAAAQPHTLVTLHVLEQAGERADSPGPADDPPVQAHGHHARPALQARTIEPVEGVAAVGEELLAGAEIAAALQAAVIVVEAMGDDEVPLAGDLHPVGQVVVVGITVIKEAAGLDEQTPGVGTRTTGVPPDGRAADQARDDFDIAPYLCALDVLRNELIVDPALSMAGDLEAARGELRGGLRITLERHAHRVNGGGCAGALQDPQDLPEPDAAAIFEEGLDVHVAHARQRIRPDIGEDRFGVTVTVKHARFASLLVVQHQRDGDARISRPARMWRAGRVADEIARVRLACGHGLSCGGLAARSAAIHSMYECSASRMGRGFQPVSPNMREVS